MRNSNTSKVLRITAGIIVLTLLVIVLFSAFYIAAETDHECYGEDCPICACIQQCENALRSIGDGAAAQSAAVVPAIFILLAIAIVITTVPRNTLVSIKVRLDN